MRIITGTARGLPLAVPRGDATRPTSDRVREAIFSSLGARVANAAVLDLFAGTGALGLEAASRGARSVVFVECSKPALACLAKNIAAIAPAAQVWRGEVLRELARLTGPFHLIFADPPYGTEIAPVLEAIQQQALLAPDGLLVWESAKRDAVVLTAGWQLYREAVYGDTRVSYVACG
ncbi:MAG: 16S rRNA (guanine(966)-N(2))-methyltransferase RsmD [Verrucomicrobiota bacterium]